MKKLSTCSLLLIALLTSYTLFQGCGSSKDDNIDKPPPPPPPGNECAGVSATFAATVAPIIQTRCAISGCHAAGSSNGPGALTTYAQISAAKSQIMDAAVTNSRMPKEGGPLTATQKLQIKCWINAGAANN